MKKRLLAGTLLAFAMLLFCHTKSNAQITGVDVTYFSDSTNNTGCYYNQSIQFNVWGSITGTASSTDSVDIYINWGDGSDTSFRTPLVQNSYFYSLLTHSYAFAGTFIPEATGSIAGLSDSEFADPITMTNACATLTGHIYMDNNSNCTADAGEAASSYHGFTIMNTTTPDVYWVSADANGDYAVSVPSGFTYTITPSSYLGLATTCPVSGSTTVTVVTGMSYNNDFGLACNTTGTTDATVQGWVSNWHPGFDSHISINTLTNNWCLSVPAIVTLTLDPLLSYVGTMGSWSSMAPTTVSGNVLTWNLTNLTAVDEFWSTIWLHCDPSAVLGDTLCVTLTVTTTPADANPANDTVVICAPVNNSLDPNAKGVSPKGIDAPGYVENGTLLTYLVEFQNEGNAPAYNVTVKDKIDADLDINTLKVLRSSHAMQPTLLPGNEMSFHFSGINLPDKVSDEPGSHGYVLYSIMPKPALAVGTEIENTADIYFDTNPAIVTNTTLNTIGIPNGIQHVSNGDLKASIFPNPASGNIYVEIDGKASFKAQLYDMIGRNVMSADSKDGRSVMNVQGLSNGMYLIKLTSEDNKVLSATINVSH